MGGVNREDPEELAKRCERFQAGTKRMFENEAGPNCGDMWFFELYHHLSDCAAALRKPAPEQGGG